MVNDRQGLGARTGAGRPRLGLSEVDPDCAPATDAAIGRSMD